MIGNLLLFVIDTARDLLTLAVVVDAILSWVPVGENIYKIRQVLGKIINPVMNPVRKLISPVTYKIGIDFSPIVAILLIDAVATILLKLVVVLF